MKKQVIKNGNVITHNIVLLLSDSFFLVPYSVNPVLSSQRVLLIVLVLFAHPSPLFVVFVWLHFGSPQWVWFTFTQKLCFCPTSSLFSHFFQSLLSVTDSSFCYLLPRTGPRRNTTFACTHNADIHKHVNFNWVCSINCVLLRGLSTTHSTSLNLNLTLTPTLISLCSVGNHLLLSFLHWRTPLLDRVVLSYIKLTLLTSCPRSFFSLLFFSFFLFLFYFLSSLLFFTTSVSYSPSFSPSFLPLLLCQCVHPPFLTITIPLLPLLTPYNK